MCKTGQVESAYSIARLDYEAHPDNVWTQIGLGWALYYKIREAVAGKSLYSLVANLKELSELDLLSGEHGKMICTNVAWKLADYVKALPPGNNSDADSLFDVFRSLKFGPSSGYSYLLSVYLKLENWEGLQNFIEWWNLDNLQAEDYQQFKMQNGRQMISLAERAYIGYAKALLRSGDKGLADAFIPKLEALAESHSEMTYPGYFCGKLMISAGASREDALTAVVPFVRKKKTEFWAWQLLADVFKDEPDNRLACLLRAVHCKAKEEFLGKVRLALALAYIDRNDIARAKYHLDFSLRCYLGHGWRLPREVDDWMRQPWMRTAVADGSDGIEWLHITDGILTYGASKSVAVVTYVDQSAKRVSVVYGKKRRAVMRLSELHWKVVAGDVFTLYWEPAADDRITVAGAERIRDMKFAETDYVRILKGSVARKAGCAFAFVGNCFVSPALVERERLTDGQCVTALSVLDYNKKKNDWTWICVSVKKIRKIWKN